MSRHFNASPNLKGYRLPAEMIPRVRVVTGAEPSCEHCAGTGFEIVIVWRGKGLDGEQKELTDLTPCRCRGGKCSMCGGRGVIATSAPVGSPDFSKTRLCPMNCAAAQRIAADRARSVVRYSQLPPEYEQLNFATFDALPALAQSGKMPGRIAAGQFADSILADREGYINRAAIAEMFGRAAADDWRNWLVLFGEHGRGKTGLASAIVNALAAGGKTCMYIRLGDFIEAVQKRYDTKRRDEGYGDEFGATAESVLDQVKTCPVLVCDEFDVADVTVNKRSIVEKLVRYRHGQQLPTVLTTNLDADGFERKWERTIAAVVRDRAHWIRMGGVNLRREVEQFEWE